MTAPQERPVAGDGLDREAVRRRAEAAGVDLAWVLDCALREFAASRPRPSRGQSSRQQRRRLFAEADLADALANLSLLDALEAAEARQREMRRRLNERFTMARSVLAAEGLDHVAALVPIEEVLAWMDEMEGVLRTEGGAS